MQMARPQHLHYDTKQLRQVGESVNYGTFSLSTSTSYNALGQKSSITYPDGNSTAIPRQQQPLSTVNLPTGSAASFLTVTVDSAEPDHPAGGTVRNQSYDGLLRLKTLAVKIPARVSDELSI